MNLDAVAGFIGRDWAYGTNDCWAVFRQASESVFGRTIPLVEIPAVSDPDATAELLDAAAAGGGDWLQIADPIPGCAVLFGKKANGPAFHIGLYIVDGNVLHCLGAPDMHGQTRYDELRVLRRLFHRIEFYDYVPDNSNT